MASGSKEGLSSLSVVPVWCSASATRFCLELVVFIGYKLRAFWPLLFSLSLGWPTPNYHLVTIAIILV